MQITLIRTGGILPVKKKADTEVDWSPAEMKELLSVIEPDATKQGSVRDGTNYLLMYNAETFSIDWEKIPAKYLKTFEQLRENLKIVNFNES